MGGSTCHQAEGRCSRSMTIADSQSSSSAITRWSMARSSGGARHDLFVTALFVAVAQLALEARKRIAVVLDQFNRVEGAWRPAIAGAAGGGGVDSALRCVPPPSCSSSVSKSNRSSIAVGVDSVLARAVVAATPRSRSARPGARGQDRTGQDRGRACNGPAPRTTARATDTSPRWRGWRRGYRARASSTSISSVCASSRRPSSTSARPSVTRAER